MCKCETLIQELKARLATVENELAGVPHVRMMRDERALQEQRERDAAMLLLSDDEKYPALAERADLATFLRGLGVRAVALVANAPEQYRDQWTRLLPPHLHNRVRLALTEVIPHNVWLSVPAGELRLSNVDVTEEQASALAGVGLGDSVSASKIHDGRRWARQSTYTPPSLHSFMRTPISAEALRVVRECVPDLDDAIESGHVRVVDFTREEDERALMASWETAPSTTVGEWIKPGNHGWAER